MFIPRHPVVENQFCSFTTVSGASTGAGGVLAYAGSVCYLVSTATNQEPEVNIYGATAPTDAEERIPFGFLMQKVKEGYHSVHPTGFYMPGDLGSSDAIAQPMYNSSGSIYGTKQVPVGVAHLGIWDTVHYTTDTAATDVVEPGEQLYVCVGGGTAATNSRVTNGTALTNVSTVVARVVKGVSAAKSAATQANSTLYPIRIKLLV
jgi:hypothetical protein